MIDLLSNNHHSRLTTHRIHPSLLSEGVWCEIGLQWHTITILKAASHRRDTKMQQCSACKACTLSSVRNVRINFAPNEKMSRFLFSSSSSSNWLLIKHLCVVVFLITPSIVVYVCVDAWCYT